VSVAAVSYSLCVLTALACAVLLSRAYRSGGSSLLFWSALCFWGLTLTNALAFIDILVFPERDLYAIRLVTGLLSVNVLLFGMVWERR
jgi:ABC-type spermidine/putrescine transport system permease subunit I